MALFPYVGPEYYDEKHRGIIAKMEASYAHAITINQAFWAEADTDARFEAGDQNVWNDVYGNVPAQRRRQFNFNRIRRVISMIDGYQRRNRKSTVVVPVENGDSKTASQFSKVIMWANGNDNVLETISDAFHGALVTGMNLLQVWLDYRHDPVSGSIRVDKCSYNSFLIDPFFKKADLSDCNFIWKRSYLTHREVISLLPKHKDEILQLNSSGNNSDNKFQFMAESYNYGKQNLLTYDEYYYRDFRSQLMLVDSQTGETMEWSGTDEQLEEFLEAYPQVTTIEQEVPTVRLAIVVQGKVMYDGPNPLGIDTYPFVPVFAYYEPDMPYFPYRIQGVVRGLRDAQYLYNRRKVIELDILESQVNSGWKYKENALVNPKDVFLSGQGKGLALKEEAQMSDVEQIQPAQVPPSMMQLSQQLGQEIQEISGVNEELLGSADDDKAGILSMLRQGAGLTTLQRLFDQLDRSQKLLGKIMMRIIQTNFMPGKIQRIIEEEPQPQFYHRAFGKYDAVIEEGVNTSTQRQLEFAQLLHLKSTGVPIPDDALIKAATIQNKDDLIEMIQQQQQQEQQQQQTVQEATLREQQARIEQMEADAKASTGLGYERLSRLNENQALAQERVAQAFENTAQARENTAKAHESRKKSQLDVIKALKEIDDIDIRNLERLLAISRMINKETEDETAQTLAQNNQEY